MDPGSTTRPPAALKINFYGYFGEQVHQMIHWASVDDKLPVVIASGVGYVLKILKKFENNNSSVGQAKLFPVHLNCRGTSNHRCSWRAVTKKKMLSTPYNCNSATCVAYAFQLVMMVGKTCTGGAEPERVQMGKEGRMCPTITWERSPKILTATNKFVLCNCSQLLTAMKIMMRPNRMLEGWSWRCKLFWAWEWCSRINST